MRHCGLYRPSMAMVSYYLRHMARQARSLLPRYMVPNLYHWRKALPHNPNGKIDRVTLKLLKKLRVDQLEEMKEKLVDIAEDGIISEDEKPDMKAIMEYLDDLSKTISEIQVAGKRALGRLGGSER